MQNLLKSFGISETFTKPVKKAKVFTKVKDNIPPLQDYNFMADLLMLPTTKRGFKYLLVVVDLWSDEVDFEPIKSRTPHVVLQALKKIFKRPHLNKPEASITTDGGAEFKGVFHKYLYNSDIYHKVSKSGRHTQVANVERMNKTLGRIFNGYMNKREVETGESYNEWTDIIGEVREKLNQIRKRPDENPFTKRYDFPDISTRQKYKVGDIVHVQLDRPKNALGHTQPTDTFRTGDFRWDTVPHKIEEVYNYSGKVPYRYRVSGIPNVSYTEKQLMPSKEEVDKYEVKALIDKRKRGNRIEYLVWWKNHLKSEATWEQRVQLMKDVPDMVRDYGK